MGVGCGSGAAHGVSSRMGLEGLAGAENRGEGSTNVRLSGRRAQDAAATAGCAAERWPLLSMLVRLSTTVSRSITSSRAFKAIDFRGTSSCPGKEYSTSPTRKSSLRE